MPSFFVPLRMQNFSFSRSAEFGSAIDRLCDQTVVVSPSPSDLVMQPDGSLACGFRFSGPAFHKFGDLCCRGLCSLVDRLSAMPMLFPLAVSTFNQVASATVDSWVRDYVMVVDQHERRIDGFIQRPFSVLFNKSVASILADLAVDYVRYESAVQGRKMVTRFYSQDPLGSFSGYTFYRGLHVYNNEVVPGAIRATRAIVISPGPVTFCSPGFKRGSRGWKASTEERAREMFSAVLRNEDAENLVPHLVSVCGRSLGLRGDASDIVRARWLRRQLRGIPGPVSRKIVADLLTTQRGGAEVSHLSLSAGEIASKTFLDLFLAAGKSGRKFGVEMAEKVGVSVMKMLTRLPRGKL
jgi:hypothetical protein